MAYRAIINSEILYDDDSKKFGTFHLSDIGEVSWYDFANAIIDLVDRKKLNLPISKKPTIRAIDSDLIVTPAKQPRYSALSTSKAEKILGITPTFWKNELESCLNEI